MKNIDLVFQLLQVLKSINVTDILICAGARNLPIINAIESTEWSSVFKVESYFEERSTAFYAIGKIKSSQQPVAIITTSGTAVAEVLPAVIEAYYQNLPLIVVSADRPKNYRGTGAPQTIEQVGIFSTYVESTFDWDIETKNFSINYSGTKPLHFNVCFDEPLIDGNYSGSIRFPTQISQANQNVQTKSIETITINQPLAIISELHQSDQLSVIQFLIKNKVIHYAEFLSGLRNRPELLHLQIQSGEHFLKQQIVGKKFASVIRLGGIPTLRFWRNLEIEFSFLPVYSFSYTEFSGLARPSFLFSIDQIANAEILNTEPVELISDKKIQALKLKLLSEFKNSEPSLISELSKIILNSPLYLGNSLPIRLWDGFTDTSQVGQWVCANRGANGIDGQVSTYLGWASDKGVSWCVVGDLTALYDLASLGLAVKTSKQKYRIVVINNSGGQIFNRLFGHQKYLNSQDVQFKSWAELWGWSYLKIISPELIEGLNNLTEQRIIIEVVPDNKQTENFWKNWDIICKKS